MNTLSLILIGKILFSYFLIFATGAAFSDFVTKKTFVIFLFILAICFDLNVFWLMWF